MNIDDAVHVVKSKAPSLYGEKDNIKSGKLDNNKVLDYIDDIYRRVSLIEKNLKKVNDLLDNDLR